MNLVKTPVQPRSLDSLIRSNFYFNGIDQSQAIHFEILFNTVVVYGYDHDTRVLEFIQRLEPADIVKLVMVQMMDDTISLYWNTGEIPPVFEEGKSLEIDYADGYSDTWTIETSCVIYDVMRIKERVLINVSLN